MASSVQIKPPVLVSHNLENKFLQPTKQKCYYYIVFGAQIGDHLGTRLMETFEDFLHHQMPNLKVYFIGNDPLDPTDFTEAKMWNSTWGAQAGAHCFSFELETKNH